ncbi:MAG: hypothetical protein RBR09_08760 [Desulfobulbaceae bacterium]|jgi:hypothetical protein|nr:hypothetical protein [Desulfobulbaceae bacterium]MDY0351331.1 hypothetical protein [Desulfobulbaceae bacterium]
MELNEFDKDMTAAAYAQAGEHEDARTIMAASETKQAVQPRVQKKKPVLGMVVFGALSVFLYVGLMMNQGWIMDVFTKGGPYTFWPLGTAMVFSFIHGAFASNFLSVMGIEARKH